MKQLNLILKFSFVILAMSMMSCKSTYYQIYRTVPDGKIKMWDNELVYEDENCIVSYNLWSNGGNIGFLFHNKTNENIIINLDQSFFVRNGEAFNYYKDRVFTTSYSVGSSKGKSASASKSAHLSHAATGWGFWGGLFETVSASAAASLSATATTFTSASTSSSISFNEQKSVIIPPKTAKRFFEYNIVESVYRDCDLFLFPKKREIRTLSFSENESPYVFSNRIAYSLSNIDEVILIENGFYVSDITNYPKREITEEFVETNCDYSDKYTSKSKTQHFKKNTITPEGFYFRYSDFR